MNFFLKKFDIFRARAEKVEKQQGYKIRVNKSSFCRGLLQQRRGSIPLAGATCGEWSESRQAAASPWSVGYYPVRRRAAPYIPQRRDAAQPPPSHLLFHPRSSPHHTFRLLLSVRSLLTSVRVWFTTTHSALCTLHSTLSSVVQLGEMK